MVLVDVDSYLEDESISNKTDASLERMFKDLLDTTRKPVKERTKEPKSHTQIAASYYGSGRSTSAGALNGISSLKYKKKRNSKSKKGKSSLSRSASSHSIGALLSLPTIDETGYNSDSESIERSVQYPSVGEVKPAPKHLSDIVWNAPTSGEDKDEIHRVSSILNGSFSSRENRKESSQRWTGKGIRSGGTREIVVEPSEQYQKHSSHPESDRPKATLPSRRKNSEGSTSSDDSTRSPTKETMISELQQIVQENAEAAPSSLDLFANSTPPSGSERHSSAEDGRAGRPANSCFKSSPSKYRQCFTYLLAAIFLASSATLLTIGFKVVKAKHGTSSALDASNTTGTGVNPTPDTAPVALSTTAPVARSTTAPTTAPTKTPVLLATDPPTVAPVMIRDTNDTTTRKPLLFLNCGGPSLQIKGRIWQADLLYPPFISDQSRTKGRDTDPLCQDFVFPFNDTDWDVVRDGDFNALFCTERYFPSVEGGGYEIPVPVAGEYRVELYFLEDFHTSSRQRVFNISMENEVIRENFDIFVRAGGAHLPAKLVKTMFVDDGAVTISMRASIGNPTINALAVYQIIDEQ